MVPMSASGIVGITGMTNIHGVNTNFIRQTLLDIIQIDSNTVIAGELNTTLSQIDRSFRQKINKDTSELNYTADQTDLTDTDRMLHPTATEYTFFLSSPQNFLLNRSSLRT
jgi:exonuclease III